MVVRRRILRGLVFNFQLPLLDLESLVNQVLQIRRHAEPPALLLGVEPGAVAGLSPLDSQVSQIGKVLQLQAHRPDQLLGLRVRRNRNQRDLQQFDLVIDSDLLALDLPLLSMIGDEADRHVAQDPLADHTLSQHAERGDLREPDVDVCRLPHLAVLSPEAGLGHLDHLAQLVLDLGSGSEQTARRVVAPEKGPAVVLGVDAVLVNDGPVPVDHIRRGSEPQDVVVAGCSQKAAGVALYSIHVISSF